MIIAAASAPALALNVSVPGYTVEIYATYTDSVKGIPRHMVFDDSGNLYVTQQDSGTVWRVTPARVASQFASGFTTPYSIAWGGGTAYGNYLYVGGAGVTRVDLNGNKTPFAYLTCTGSMAIDRTGDYGGFLYVGTGCSDDIRKIDTAGIITQFTPWPGSATGGVYGIDFDLGTAYGGLMYVGNEYGQSNSSISGLFSMSTGGSAARFSGNLVQVWDVDFDKTGLFGGLLFVIGRTSYVGPAFIYSVGVDGVATEFASSTMLNGHGMTFGTDGAMYISEISQGWVIINRIAPAAPVLELTKTDDVNDGDCVVPDSQINYTISYQYTTPASDTNIVLTDYLPIGVDYNSSNPPGDYNDADRTVTWNIGTVHNGSGTFTLTCMVNYDADPCSIITNTCRLIGDATDETAEVNTPTCFWNQIIYVDHNAAGLDNGLTWKDAYTDLQDALERAAVEVNSEIWVAGGTYKPSVSSEGPTFRLIDSVPVYGHFAGNETSKIRRDFNNANNETILSGINTFAPFVVTAAGFASDNIIDGFTLLGAGTSGDGIKIENAYITVSNCVIEGASVAGYGIYALNSGFKIIDCVIQDSSVGIYSNFQNNGSLPETLIDNCVIRNNQTGIGFYSVNPASPVEITNNVVYNNNYGVLLSLSSSTPVIKECLFFSNASGIYLNGSSASILNNFIYRNTQSGISLYSPISPTTIRNDTIALNNQYGIYRSSGTTPVIDSSIIWGNPVRDVSGCTATYSLLTINGDPCFVDADANDFHIKSFSQCVNAGDPNFADLNEVDIDGQCRIMIGQTTPRVDIGADEIGWPKPDYNRDEVINFTDYTILTSSWLLIDPDRSLDSDEDVDIDDLAEFCDLWLWETSL